MTPAPQRGGKRPGAGRPKGPKRVAMTIRPLESSYVAFKALCAARSPPLSYEKGFEWLVDLATKPKKKPQDILK